MTRLLALVDGSIYSQSVCDHAAWLAGRMDAAVTVMHVLGHRQGVKPDLSGSIGLGARTALMEELAELDAAAAKLAQKRGRAILEDAKARIEQAGVRDVETRLRNGDLVETLQEAEGEADLLVVGKRGEAADFAKAHLGSNMERAVRASGRPVLVSSREFRPIRRFLVAFDGGAAAMKAVDFVSRSPAFGGLDGRLLSVGKDEPELRRGLEGAAALLRAGGREVAIEIVPGRPEEAIAAKVSEDEVDLLVMGAYGHSRLRSLIMSSTTTEIIRGCQIPLLLFR